MGGFCHSLVYPHMKPNFSPAELHTLFLKSQTGALDAGEAQHLAQWRAASPEHEREWQELLALWQITPPHIPQGAALEIQWANLSARIDAEESEHIVAESWRTRTRQWLASLAPQFAPRPRWAIASIALVVLFVLSRWAAFDGAPELQTAHAPFGERVQFTLADGSRVELNAGSALRYPTKFSKEARRVELTGEAFFEVQRGATPFEITTPHASVRVLGTSFNVRTWERATTVFVQTGKVSVRSNHTNGSAALLLEPGQAARCDTLRAPLRLEMTNDAFAWREGKLVFQRRPLAEVLHELQRHFNVRIQAEPALLTHTVTATFANEPLPTVLEALAAAIDARCEREAEAYWLREEAHESR